MIKNIKSMYSTRYVCPNVWNLNFLDRFSKNTQKSNFIKSIIKRQRLYIQHQVHVIQVLWLLATKQPQNLYGMMLWVQS